MFGVKVVQQQRTIISKRFRSLLAAQSARDRLGKKFPDATVEILESIRSIPRDSKPPR